MTLPQLLKALADPRGQELEIGRAILALKASGELPPDHPSLFSLLKKTSALDYSYVMKWIRAADFVNGTDHTRAEWGISRLIEVLSIEDADARERFLTDLEPSALSVRRLREEVRRFLNGLPGPEMPTAPHEVTAEAVRVALRRHSPEALGGVRVTAGGKTAPSGSVAVTADVVSSGSGRALAVTGDVLAEIAAVREVWRTTPSDDLPEHWALPLEQIAQLPAGPVTVSWAAPNLVHVRRDRTLVAKLPVSRESIGRIARPRGNEKTAGVCGILNSIHLGCLRRATNFPSCDLPCYLEEGSSCGCFANVGPFAAKEPNRQKQFCIVHNGLVNNLLDIVLPVTGDASLDRYHPRQPHGQPLTWRVDAESADGAMSVALGNLQMWSEAT